MGEAGKYNIFYISNQPLYTEQEINELNEHIDNCKIRQEREDAAAIGANKKSRVSVITWLEIKEQLINYTKKNLTTENVAKNIMGVL